MTATQWQTLGVIFAIVVGVATIYYLRQSSSREAARLREADAQRRVDTATAPLLARIADQERVIERRDATIAIREARIDVLEDELRRGRGHGDSDAQRQPGG